MKKLFVFMLLSGSLSVKAAEIQLDFVFADNNTGAEAVGFIVVDDAFLINPVAALFGEGLVKGIIIFQILPSSIYNSQSLEVIPAMAITV